MPYRANYDELEPKKIAYWLGKMKRDAVVSPDLRAALAEAEAAMKAGDYPIAEELTAVKGMVVGKLTLKNPPYEYHFRENEAANTRKFGDSVYMILDRMTHELSFNLGNMPEGVILVDAGGIHTRGPPKGESPTLRLMRDEHRAMVDEFEARKFKE